MKGLRWDRIDFQAGTILVDRQWNAKVAAFTPPKHGVVRTIALTDPARERLHQDGGELVRKLYGHADARLPRERVRQAFKQAPPAPLPLVSAAV